MQAEIELSVSQFVASVNETFEFAYPFISIIGELSNFRISKNQWVYFDLKDDLASVRCFGTVYRLPGPLEDGMLLKVAGNPRLHSQYGFSFNIQSIRPVGEGSIKKAADLLTEKLTKEGIFDTARKRLVPYPPQSIGLITSAQSAAYADFIKILNQRWGGIAISLVDVLVQGESAPASIIDAIETLNQQAEPPEALVITRGGGSPEDLWAFNTEQVTRAIAGSRIPTIVAIGHEIDISLAERVADMRASTPSNAAELIVPDRNEVLQRLSKQHSILNQAIKAFFAQLKQRLVYFREVLDKDIKSMLDQMYESLASQKKLLEVLSPNSALKRGYAIIHYNNKIVSGGGGLSVGNLLQIMVRNAEIHAKITKISNITKE